MLKTASSNVSGALIYRGTWNASTNTPTLQSGVGTKGDYYVVSVAGNTNLDGITDWQVNDWAVFNGLVWQKIDNTDSVLSVNGKTGVVVLTASDVGAVSNTTSVIAGTGLTGGGQLTSNVTLNLGTSGVTAGIYGGANTTVQINVDAQGRITSAANISLPSGTVTQVNTGTGLTGGPITTTGTISLANTTVTAASYTYASITVDAQGRLTAASSGTAPVTSVTGTSPVVSSGGTTPAISMPAANATTNGYLTSTDWNTFNNKQSGGTYVTSVSGTTGRISSTGGTTPVIDLVNTAVTAASYGSASNVASFTVDAAGRLTAASNTAIAISVSAVSGAVPNTVNVIAGTGLSGGGALTGNVTLNVAANTTQQLVTVQNNGVAVGTRQVHNFIPGNNVTITASDDAANGRANVTIAVSGLGTMATQNANSVTISGGTIQNVALTLDSLNSTPIGNSTPSTAVFTTMSTSGVYATIVTKTANYTLTTTDFTVLGNASSGAITLTLPTAVGVSGQIYTLKKIDSSANVVTIATTSAQTIDGQSSYSLSLQYAGIQIQSNNSNWVIIDLIQGRNGVAGTF